MNSEIPLTQRSLGGVAWSDLRIEGDLKMVVQHLRSLKQTSAIFGKSPTSEDAISLPADFEHSENKLIDMIYV